MEKTTILLLLLASLFCEAMAQVKIGMRAGLNFSAVTLEDEDEKDLRMMLPGINGGLAMEIGKEVLFCPGIIISMQGHKGRDGGYKYLFRTTYLNIPIAMKVNFGKSTRVSGYFTLGTYVAIWMRARIVVAAQGDKVSIDYEFDHATDNRLDVGASVGGGVNIHLGKRALQMGPLFSMGLLDMVKYPAGNGQDTKPFLNIVLTGLNVTYLFHVHSKKDKPMPPDVPRL